MKSKTRKGFTLVELLVVIAIIGILVALLLPAVQAAREAARRMQCGNNLHQLGIGFHNYHDTFKTLPPALVWWNNGVAPDTADNACWSWGTLILPFVEQQPLHDTLQPGTRSLAQAANNAATRAAMEQSIGYYRCPSDVAPKLNNVDVNAMINGTIPLATSNYVASTTSRAYAHRNGAATGPADTTIDAEARARVVHAGAFVEGIGINFSLILDGTANVIAAGERRWRFKSTAPQGTAAGPVGTIRLAGAANVFGVRDRTTDARKRRVMGSSLHVMNYDHEHTNGNADEGYSSQHPGGAQFVFCDGSVHFISETVDTGPRDPSPDVGVCSGPNQPDSVWEGLAARADGSPVTIP